jgi:hypothetical protein
MSLSGNLRGSIPESVENSELAIKRARFTGALLPLDGSPKSLADSY